MANFDPRTLRQLTDACTNRRRLLQGSAALGLGAALPIAGRGRSTAAQDATTLSFYHDKAPWQDFFIEMGELAQAAIGINWEPTAYSDVTTYQAAIQQSLPTDDAPDFFTWWSGYRIESLWSNGALHDVSDLWAQAVTDGNLPESLGAAFTFEDKQYALPSHVSYWVVFYNKKVFADNGITPPTTWDEFIANADKLKAAGVTPFATTTTGRWPSFIWFEEMMLRTDPQFYADLTAGKAKYTDPTAVQAMETWKGLLEAEYFSSLDTDMTNDWPGMFAQGEIAMIAIGTWYQGQLMAAGMTPGEDFDLFIMPNIASSVTSKVAIVETGALAIPANGQNIDAAKQLAAWWVTPEAQTAWCQKLGDAPANPNAASDNPVLTNLLGQISSEGYTLYQRYWEASPVPIVEGAVDFLAEFMLDPSSYMSVLENIQNLADTEWESRGGVETTGTPTSGA